nr:malto-oligosyltrehalose synthase [Methylomarinum sp. Ch1-1]MDP4519705.1 malto-oligosyltrehalose synthase [Methylomarinum sp. Ch1-1]
MNHPGDPPPMAIPVSTYRLQLNKHCRFSRAADYTDYLHRLGISHCYASPYLKARPGSTHGYDIVDHNALNPEIGDDADFNHFISRLRRFGMGLICDIVPNHMGVMGADNAWWLDVLENGPASCYAPFFDIDWHPVKKQLNNKILIPILGDQYGNILEKRQLKLVFSAERGEFSVYYFQHRFPLDPQTYSFILSSQHQQLLNFFDTDDPVLLEYQTLDNSFSKLSPHSEVSMEATDERNRDKEVFKNQLARLCADHPSLIQFIKLRMADINREISDRGQLHALLEQQAYRLAYWHVAGDEINYRRFFDINDLAGLRIEDDAVFEASHRLILRLIAERKIQGLRIDHADGLYDPVAYYRRLNDINTTSGLTASPLYVIAEKIVANYEYLDSDWPIHGTTGYEFAAIVTGVMLDGAAEKAMTRIYSDFIGRHQDFDEIVYQAKKYVITTLLAGELTVLANQLSRIAETSSKTRDYTLNALRDALSETVACFPVYRTYINSYTVRKEDAQYIAWSIEQAKQRSRAADKTVFDFIRAVLMLQAASSNVPRDALLKFVMKFQQYTAPVMAKGSEDTALYEYHRLISLNEVGADPRHFGYSVNAFHHFNQERVKKWPHSLLCLSSHDSKRSADVRARINVLSEMPQQWRAAVYRWRDLNRERKKTARK